jgi:hypothetical protein
MSPTISIRRLGLCCALQSAMALAMGAIGTVDRHTVIPACYFSLTTLVVAWLMRDGPNR